MSLEETVIEENADQQVIVRYTPLGVAVAIVPWNCKSIYIASITANSLQACLVPIALACPKIVSALLTGNTVILKPS
jgi:acyl-CoA reductase-like NAD-dependent aldehyde dehydrogenase